MSTKDFLTLSAAFVEVTGSISMKARSLATARRERTYDADEDEDEDVVDETKI